MSKSFFLPRWFQFFHFDFSDFSNFSEISGFSLLKQAIEKVRVNGCVRAPSKNWRSRSAAIYDPWNFPFDIRSKNPFQIAAVINLSSASKKGFAADTNAILQLRTMREIMHRWKMSKIQFRIPSHRHQLYLHQFIFSDPAAFRPSRYAAAHHCYCLE